MTAETLVLLLTAQKWVNVIMWPEHRRNLSLVQQQQQHGNVLMTNPWGTLPLASSNSALCSLIFLSSHSKSEPGHFCWQPAAHLCQARHIDKHIYALTVTPYVFLSCLFFSLLSSSYSSYTHTHTHTNFTVTFFQCRLFPDTLKLRWGH